MSVIPSFEIESMFGVGTCGLPWNDTSLKPRSSLTIITMFGFLCTAAEAEAETHQLRAAIVFNIVHVKSNCSSCAQSSVMIIVIVTSCAQSSVL